MKAPQYYVGIDIASGKFYMFSRQKWKVAGR